MQPIHCPQRWLNCLPKAQARPPNRQHRLHLRRNSVMDLPCRFLCKPSRQCKAQVSLYLYQLRCHRGFTLHHRALPHQEE